MVEVFALMIAGAIVFYPQLLESGLSLFDRKRDTI